MGTATEAVVLAESLLLLLFLVRLLGATNCSDATSIIRGLCLSSLYSSLY